MVYTVSKVLECEFWKYAWKFAYLVITTPSEQMEKAKIGSLLTYYDNVAN